ncbi:hypothetical protein [Nocardioides carbamazepini]|nr:hypothetical protein [Nocardioides carbamazepini]
MSAIGIGRTMPTRHHRIAHLELITELEEADVVTDDDDGSAE